MKPRGVPPQRASRVAIIVLVFALLLGANAYAQPAGKRIIGYYTSWSIYARNYHVPSIPADSITHINYAFANISGGQIALGDYYADVDRFYPGDCWDAGCLRGCFHRLQLLKASHPHVKTLISVGGWTWSSQFSDMASTDAGRRAFASSCAAFVNQYQFDGVDIDWEYPVEGGLPGNPHRPEDGHNLTLLMAQLRQVLDSLGQTNQHTYYLSYAGPSDPAKIAHLELQPLAQSLDWFNIMTYDFHGPWGPPADTVTNFNAPLYAVPEDPTPEPYHSAFNLSSAIQAYLTGGIPASKLNAGLSFYGRGYGSVPNQNDGLFVTYNNPAPVGTWENGVFDYWDLAQNYVNTNGYTRHWQGTAMVPWLFNPTAQIMISYDDSLSIALKVHYINSANLGGAMFWEFSGDRNSVLLGSLFHEFACTGPQQVTAFLSTDNAHIRVSFDAPFVGSYRVYSATIPNSVYYPNSPDWTLESTLTALSPGRVSYLDLAYPVIYKSYVVTHQCAMGR